MVNEATLRTALRQALRAGHREARKRLLHINDLGEDQLFFPIDGSHHVGDPQHIADAVVLDAVENALREQLPLVRVIGEESLRSVRAREYPIAVLDPIDGTKPFTHLGGCWAIVLNIVEPHAATGQLHVTAASIATSAGILVGIWEEQTVTVELLEDETSAVTVIDCAPRGDRPLSLASVGAKAADSSRYLALRNAFPEATIFTTGGNPVVVGVLTGDLDAIVSFDHQCNWDATYAMAISLAGGTVGATTHDEVFTLPEILSWFRRPLQGTEKETKVVPPIIAAKDASTYAEIVAQVIASGVGTDGQVRMRCGSGH
jgi:fructose-1,6-bisphosphatase/inositol monophosphatase family enzyme